MTWPALIRRVGRGARGARDLAREEARALFAAMLAGEVPDLELGALLIAYRIKGEGPDELLGFDDALVPHVAAIVPPPTAICPTVVFGTYNGARRQPNLLPLLALLLAREGIPVLMHGVRTDADRVTTPEVLSLLGHAPAESPAEAAQQLVHSGVAFVPVDVLSPPLARLLATRARIGVRSSPHTLAKLMRPVAGECVRVIGVTHPTYHERASAFLAATRGRALLMRGTEGQPFAHPRRAPTIEYFHDGLPTTLAEPDPAPPPDAAPATPSAEDVAASTEQALAGSAPIPAPLAHQFACCLLACGIVESVGGGLARLEARLMTG